MGVVLAIHEATRTGAPRVAGLIARELAREEPVRVLLMKDGPLTPWLQATVGAPNISVPRGDPFQFRETFAARVAAAEDMLRRESGDVVYVNSLAASVFALAAARLNRKTILHVHEKSDDMLNLLAHDVTKIEAIRAANAVILAASDLAGDLVDTFRFTPPDVSTFGVAVDVESIRHSAQASAPSPRNAGGSAYRPSQGRLAIGMCGHASGRKGADIFLETAKAMPGHDFFWVGGWSPEETPDNVAYEAFKRNEAPNLYVTGATDNPYPYMRAMDLFFLSSREDPNPVVLAEAVAVGVPILAFSKTTAVADRLGRYAIFAFGEPNVADAVRILAACKPETLRTPAFRAMGENYVEQFDIRAKMRIVRGAIARLRGEAPTTHAAVA